MYLHFWLDFSQLLCHDWDYLKKYQSYLTMKMILPLRLGEWNRFADNLYIPFRKISNLRCTESMMAFFVFFKQTHLYEELFETSHISSLQDRGSRAFRNISKFLRIHTF